MIQNNSDYIPKIFRDKIHSIEKIEGDYQKCVQCLDEGKKSEYFCPQCEIFIHPECFDDYHFNHIYKNDIQ